MRGYGDTCATKEIGRDGSMSEFFVAMGLGERLMGSGRVWGWVVRIWRFGVL